MRKSFIFFLALILFVSCSLSEINESEEENQEKNLVRVCFVQQSTKSLSSGYASGNNLKYYLTATPLFTRGTRTIVGNVTEQAITPDANGDFDAGYFEQGSWKFVLDAYVENGKTGEDKIKTLYATQTIESQYISQASNTVSFVLTEAEATGNGSLTICVKVPKLAASGASLKAYDGSTDLNITATSSDAKGDEKLLQFDATVSSITAGSHNIKLEYYIKDSESKDVKVSSDIIPIYVPKDANILISGTMMNEKYAEGKFSVVISTDVWSIAISPEEKDLTSSTSQEFSCTLTGVPKDVTPTYQWYVDGVAVSGQTAAKYSFSATAPGVYCVTCVATVSGFSKSMSAYAYVTKSQGN